MIAGGNLDGYKIVISSATCFSVYCFQSTTVCVNTKLLLLSSEQSFVIVNKITKTQFYGTFLLLTVSPTVISAKALSEDFRLDLWSPDGESGGGVGEQEELKSDRKLTCPKLERLPRQDRISWKGG